MKFKLRLMRILQVNVTLGETDSFFMCLETLGELDEFFVGKLL